MVLYSISSFSAHYFGISSTGPRLSREEIISFVRFSNTTSFLPLPNILGDGSLRDQGGLYRRI